MIVEIKAFIQVIHYICQVSYLYLVRNDEGKIVDAFHLEKGKE